MHGNKLVFPFVENTRKKISIWLFKEQEQGQYGWIGEIEGESGAEKFREPMGPDPVQPMGHFSFHSD